MGPPSYMRSAVDRNFVIRRIPVLSPVLSSTSADTASRDLSKKGKGLYQQTVVKNVITK